MQTRHSPASGSVVWASLVLLWTLGAVAQATEPAPSAHTLAHKLAYQLDIAAQPIDDALHEFGRQSGLQIFLASEEGKGITTPRILGTFTAQDALTRMLSNTGLHHEYLNERTIAIRAAKSKSDASSSASVGVDGESLKVTGEDWKVAQSDSASADANTAQAAGGSSSAAQESDVNARKEPDKIQEIVVTAQKRGEERLQDVPISISVLSGEQLDSSSFANVTDALRTLPGIDINQDQYSGGITLSIRGVSNPASKVAGPGPVAYYMDGVPFGFVRTAIFPADPSVYDLQQMELLSGPQGTLYGANALNGVLRVLTQDANADKFEFKARTSIAGTDGGDDSYRGDAMVNVPVIEGKLGVRAVVGYQNDAGWIDAPNRDDVNDAQGRNYRLKVHAQPTDTLAINLSAWRSQTDKGALSFASEDMRTGATHEQSSFEEMNAYGFEVVQDFPLLTVSSMTSYLNYDNSAIIDATPLGLTFGLRTAFGAKVFSEEVNFISKLDGPWRWSAGAFYRDAEDRTFQVLEFYPEFSPASATGFSDDFRDTSKSAAVYGEIGRRFFHDEIEVSFGLRYFRDKQASQINQPYPAGLNIPSAPTEVTSDAVTPRAVLTWKPTSDQTVYVSYSQGFRSGFVQVPQLRAGGLNFPPVDPDKLSNYEVGAKGSAWNGRISYEAAVFYIDWQNVQQNLAVLFPNGLAYNGVVNGVSASGLGGSLVLAARLFEGFQLGANVSWNDLGFDEDVVSGGNTISRKGDRLGLSPEYTTGAFARYNFPLGASGFAGKVEMSGNYKPPQNTITLSNTTESDDILVIGARLSIQGNNHWSGSVYADNLNNESGSPDRPFPIAGLFTSRLRPRTIGLQIEYSFN